MKETKAVLTAVIGVLMSWLGILAIPVFILVACNVMDYFTGLCAAKYRKDQISSYKGIRGIIKKVCMWLLIFVGFLLDTMISYAATYAGIGMKLPFIVAMVVAVWLIINEIISILENMIDIGVTLPPFLLPLAQKIRKQMEDKTEITEAIEKEEEK